MTSFSSDPDFAALFEASIKTSRPQKGQTIEGTLVAIGPEVAFVNVGGKGEAMIDVAELKDADGALEVAVGDRIQAVVVSTEGGLTLSRKLARGAANARQVEDAYRAQMPVEGKVEAAIKGGFSIRIGGLRAFCPISQIDTLRSTDPAEHIGRVYAFRIIEFKDNGRNLVVSRRALLEEEQRAGAADIRRSVVPGAVLSGRVASVVDFGAFIDLGSGVQGLLHVSEMSWSRGASPAELVSPGQTLTVKVLRVEQDGQKIALGLKQLSGDPWETVPARYAVGQVHLGRVTRVADFGAFVELEPGVEGLAHASSFAPTGRADAWAKAVPVGTTGAFEILSVEPDKKRLGVALVPEGSSRASTAGPRPTIAAGDLLTGKVERHEPFGVFVFLGPGRSGLIPMSETDIANEADVAKALPVGADVEVVVLEVDAAGRRLRLSRKAVRRVQEAAEVREYTLRKGQDGAQGFGSLADKFRGALGSKTR